MKKRELPEWEVTLPDDTKCKVRYYYDKGRPATRWEPDEPAELAVESVSFTPGKWEPLETYPQLNVQAIEQEIGNWISEQEAHEQEAWAEAYYRSIKEDEALLKGNK